MDLDKLEVGQASVWAEDGSWIRPMVVDSSDGSWIRENSAGPDNFRIPSFQGLPWNGLHSRLCLALAMLFQLRRQEPPVHLSPGGARGTSAIC